MMLLKVATCFLLLAGFTTVTTVGIFISPACLLRICSPAINSCGSSLSTQTNLTVSDQDADAINDLLGLVPVGDSAFDCSCNDVDYYRRKIGCDCNLDLPNNGTCRVTYLDLSNMNLKGTLSDTIGNLTFLDVLDLSGNKLYGLVPTSLVNLTQLSYVYLYNNFLEGPIPPFNGTNKVLRGLYLSRNRLNGSIPKELGELHQSLQYLYLRYNALTGPIPNEIWNITSLLQLKLQDNQIDGLVPEQLGNLNNLQEILLMNNNFSGVLPKSIGELKNLQILKIQGSNFIGTIPDTIGQLPNLQALWLMGNNLTGPLPKTFSSKGLLDLAISDVSGDAKGNPFPDVGNLINLWNLTLRNCSLTGEIPDQVWKLPNLTYLDLSFNELFGKVPPILGKDLKTIYLRRNKLNESLPAGWFNLTGLYADLSENLFTNATFPNDNNISNHINLFSCCSSNTSDLKWLDVRYRCANDLPPNDHLYINSGGNAEYIEGGHYEADLDPNGKSSFFLGDKSAWGYSSMGDSMYGRSKYILNETCNISMVDAPFYTGARIAPLSLKYYGFCLRKGNYTVRLHFAEIGWDEAKTKNTGGRRVFNVEIQGKKVLQDFNIEEAAGGIYKSTTQEFDTSVDDKRLEIHFYWSGKGSMFYPQLYGPLISAISVSAVPKKHHKLRSWGIGAIVGSSAVFVGLILGLFWMLGWLGGKKPNKEGVELYPGGFFKFQDIKDATNNFDPKNKIGEGGSVYKGKLKDETEIAVKVLSAKSKQGAIQILQEIGLIYTLEHPYIAKPMGCCTKERQVLLVYKYMENISLQNALFDSEEVRSRLNWQTRSKICLGIAKGLAFLHEESKLDIIHSNIKPTNILLDKDFNVKISDFRYSELHDGQLNEQEILNKRRAKDTGHMAPEYMAGLPLTPKADVYSFGLVTLEIISGQPHIIFKAKKEDIQLLNTAYKYDAEGSLEALIDENLRSHKDYKLKEAASILQLAMWCVSPSFDLRPKMSEVVEILEGKKKLKRKHINALPIVESIVSPSMSTGSGSTSQEGAPRKNISDSHMGEMDDSVISAD